MATVLRKLAPHRALIGVIVVFLLVIAVVNPLWETAYSDDWAFARMSHDLFSTGRYVQSEWLAPNSPLHVLWGTLAARIGGFSFGSLRVSTLCLMLVALLSTYFLAKDLGLRDDSSAFLTVVLLSSPLVLLMAFTFMSEVPFLAWMTLALLLLYRGFRDKNVLLILAGSAATAAAILVRQSGVVILLALALAWFFARDRKQSILLYAAALPIPLLALGWQFIQPHSWGLRWLAVSQDAYLHMPLRFLPQAIWRVMVTLQYLAFSIPALTILALVEIGSLLRTARRSRSHQTDLWLIIGFTLFILGTSLLGTFMMGERGIIPLIPWNLNDFTKLPAIIPAVVTLLTTFGAVALGRIFCLRYLKAGRSMSEEPHKYLIDFAALGLLIINLINVQIGDRYLIPLIPYALITAGQFLQPQLERYRWQMASTSLAVLLVASLWIRSNLSERAAHWAGAELIRARGVDPTDIVGSNEWNLYYGSFDLYLETLQGQIQPDSQDNYFRIWRANQIATAHYQTSSTENDPAGPGWKIIATLPYQDMLLQEHNVVVLQRSGGS